MKDRPIRVLFGIPQLDHGGPDRVFFELLRGMDRSRFKPLLMCQVPGGYYWERLPPDVDRIVLPLDSGKGRKKYPVFSLARAVNNFAPQMVVTTLSMIFTAALGKVTKHLPMPLIIRPANHLTANAWELLQTSPLRHSVSFIASIATLYIADHVICQSNGLRKDFMRYGPIRTKSSVIPNPVDIDEILCRARESCNPPRGNPSIVAVGRLMRQKGFDLLIKAIRSLIERYPRLYLTILGEGPERSELDYLVRSLELEKHVSMPGVTDNPWRIMQRSDLIVSSSRYEGLPNAVLEALACGKPVVATDCPGGIRELIVDGVTGWLCPPESPSALAETIDRGLRNCKAISPVYLQNFIRETFSCNRIVRAYEDVFTTILSSRPR
jgi:glycosyltransferase involved in cell wall biosynthesis